MPFHSQFSRRDYLRGFGAIAIGATLSQTPLKSAWANVSPPTQATAVSPDEALAALLEGNQRFIQQQGQHPHQTAERLLEVAQAQAPFATILSCADSRVPAEILFDQGIGDLFDIRVAGNIVTPAVLGSLEYAAMMLECPLIMVMGHERCGAVTAAVQGGNFPGHISSFVSAISPAITKSKAAIDDPIEASVVANVRYQVEQITALSPLLAQRIQNNQLKVVGSRYDLDTGKILLV